MSCIGAKWQLSLRDAISVCLVGFQTQELWGAMEICKSTDQTASFKEGKEVLAGSGCR